MRIPHYLRTRRDEDNAQGIGGPINRPCINDGRLRATRAFEDLCLGDDGELGKSRKAIFHAGAGGWSPGDSRRRKAPGFGSMASAFVKLLLACI